jgi:acyl-CoA synthetase (NDP forming)
MSYTLSEHESKQLLAEAGIPIPREHLVSSPDETVFAAERLGYPVALKLCGRGIAHKTERNLLRLDVSDAEGVRSGAAELLAQRRPEESEAGLLVQSMVSGRRELIAGLMRDPQFGPCVMLGLGGVFAEVVADVAFAVAPLEDRDARDLVRSLRHREILGPFRGEPGADLGRLTGVLEALGRIGASRPDVLSIDLNPVILAGAEPVVVDALVELEDEPSEGGRPLEPIATSGDLVEQLDPIFRPRSIALVGASANPAKWGGMVLGRVLASEFRGPIYPVNPKESSISGLRAYSDVAELPEPVDLAIFTIPAAHMPRTVGRCVERGIRGGVVISADFAETGARGEALQEETVRIARAGGMRLVGPNGNGIWSSAVGLNASPLPNPTPGALAFVSQSGMFGGAAILASASRGFGLSKVISIGNQADLTAADYLEYLARDDDTRVIALYMEGFKDGRRFLRVAREVSRQKPVLILRGGRSARGARATLSHTASIAGEDRIFDAMCRQAGIIRVAQLEHLFVMAEALLSQPIPRGKRIAVVGNGGQSVTTVDNLDALDLDVPELQEADRLALKELLPPHAPVPRNPVDFAAGAMDTTDEVRVIEKLASLDYIDGIITNVPRDRSFRHSSLAERKKEVLTAVDSFSDLPARSGKPIITQRMMPSENVVELLKDARVPIYDTPQECALAMYALVRYGQIRDGD